jgi:hypothetical protein
MVHIIGVDHLVQYDGPVPEPVRREFKIFVIENARTLRVKLIAEEFSLEALHDVYEAGEATVREAAREAGIEHRFCDPEEADLRALGIPYHVEVMDRVKRKHGVSGFILDPVLRKKIDLETAEITRSYWSLREEFWYSRIADRINLDILFICGHEHVNGFRALLKGRGHASEVIDPFWNKGLFSDYANLGLE